MALFDLPPFLEDVRRRLFALEDEVYLSSNDYNTYWPYASNIWTPIGAPRVVGTRTTSYFRCRLFRTQDWTPPDGKTRRRERQKPSRTAIGCGMRMRVV